MSRHVNANLRIKHENEYLDFFEMGGKFDVRKLLSSSVTLPSYKLIALFNAISALTKGLKAYNGMKKCYNQSANRRE
jgi:hypothetical protein